MRHAPAQTQLVTAHRVQRAPVARDAARDRSAHQAVPNIRGFRGTDIAAYPGGGWLQRKCACGGSKGSSEECAECAERQGATLQRSATQRDHPGTAPPIVHEVLRSPGQLLDVATRAYMESRFGQDFGNVRVHTGAQAAASAQAVDAQAYTVGRDIVFAEDRFAPATLDGKRLLAHELAHTLQQQGSASRPAAQLTVNQPGDAHEIEADRVADSVVDTAASVAPAMLRRDAPGQSIHRQKGGDKAKAAPAWTADELKKMLDTCDGGLGIWAKAKKANGDNDPKIVPGAGGEMDINSGTITLDETKDKCFAVQQLVQELSNMSRAADVVKYTAEAAAGDLSREQYIKSIEKLEYETGVKNVLTAFDACKDKWGCKTTPKEWARKAKNFDEYFTKLLSDTHKEHYGTWWDTHYKAAYDKKHAKKK